MYSIGQFFVVFRWQIKPSGHTVSKRNHIELGRDIFSKSCWNNFVLQNDCIGDEVRLALFDPRPWGPNSRLEVRTSQTRTCQSRPGSKPLQSFLSFFDVSSSASQPSSSLASLSILTSSFMCLSSASLIETNDAWLHRRSFATF